MDDEDLLRRARDGDRDAFSGLVDRHQDRLYTTALRILGNTADAADVVQEALLRAWLHIGELEASGLRSWLLRVTINCCRDQQRRQARRTTTPLEDEQGNVLALPDPSPGPEREALAHERTTAVLDALRRLPMNLRTVVVLRDVNDLSYDEIAAVLRIPVGTAKSRVNRGRLQLATQLRRSPLFTAAEETA